MHSIQKLQSTLVVVILLLCNPLKPLFANDEAVVVVLPPKMDSSQTDGSAFLGELIQNELSSLEGMTVVDRENFSKYLEELALKNQGIATPDSNQIGQVFGADFFVTTRVYKLKDSDKGHVLVRVTDVATTRTKGASISVENLLEMDFFKVAASVGRQVHELAGQLKAIPAKAQQDSEQAEALRIPENWKRPNVAVSIEEQHVNREVIDPASEVRIIKRLISQKIPVIDVHFSHLALQGDDAATQLTKAVRVSKAKEVDYLIYGEGVSQEGGRVGNFVNCRARVEIRVVDTTSGRIVFTGSATRGASDTSEVTAAKTALGYAADALVAELIPALANIGNE